jgi:hypothetical protein
MTRAAAIEAIRRNREEREDWERRQREYNRESYRRER